MRILIAGAGIGGLTAALALRQAGFDTRVYEQASVLREVGAGVAISPNAVFSSNPPVTCNVHNARS